MFYQIIKSKLMFFVFYGICIDSFGNNLRMRTVIFIPAAPEI